jgi:hypothetical protein
MHTYVAGVPPKFLGRPRSVGHAFSTCNSGFCGDLFKEALFQNGSQLYWEFPPYIVDLLGISKS